MTYTYQQLEVIRERALKMKLVVEWCGRREEDDAWLRVSQGPNEIMMCWFPGRHPILSVEIQTNVAVEVAHAALELVALHATLTSGLSTGLDWGPEVAS